MNGNVMVEARTPILVKDTDIWTPPQKGEIFLPNGRGGYELQKPLEERVDHEIKVKKGILSKDKVVVDGKTFVGKKQGKVVIAENYRPSQLSKIAGVAVLGLATAGGIGSLVSCSKRDNPVGPSLPQNYNIRVHHCIEGEKSMITKTAVPGEYLTVNISESGLSNIDTNWIAAFEPNVKDFIDIGRNGSVAIRTDQNHTEYAVMVFNKLVQNQITGLTPEYDWMYDQNAKLWNNKTRHSIYRRDLDNVTEKFNLSIPDNDWQYVINHFKDVLGINSRGALYINTSNDHSKDDFPYGYAICYWQGKRVDGLHGGPEGVVVDPERLDASSARRGVGFAEMFEQLTGTQNIGGRPSSMVIQSQGEPLTNLRDLLNFVYAIKAGSAESTGGISVRIGFK